VPFDVAVTVELVFEDTLAVVTVNVADVLPAAIVTVFGAVAFELLQESAITRPPVGAAEVMVTVPVDDLPPTTDAGLTVSDLIVGGLTVSEPVAEAPFKLPVTVAVIALATATVLAVNVTVLRPAETVTDAGTVVLLELLDNFTTSPPVGALPVRVTVPIEEALPTTIDGVKLTDLMVASVMVRFPL